MVVGRHRPPCGLLPATGGGKEALRTPVAVPGHPQPRRGRPIAAPIDAVPLPARGEKVPGRAGEGRGGGQGAGVAGVSPNFFRQRVIGVCARSSGAQWRLSSWVPGVRQPISS